MMPLDQVEAFLSGPMLVAALAGLGLAVGVLTGLFGVGGTFLLNPVLMVALGMSEPLVIGSSLSFTIGASATGAARHMRGRNVDVRGMLLIAMGAVPGAIFGAFLLKLFYKSLDLRDFKALVRTLYCAVLLLTAWVVFRNQKPHESGKSFLQRLSLPPHVDLLAAGLTQVSLPGLLLAGLAIGIATGLLGLGGGILLMPLLLLVVGMSVHKAIGTSLGVILFSAAAGTIMHGLDGNVSLIMAMTMLAGSSLGVQIGAAICERLHAGRLRRYFAGILLLAAVMTAADLARIVMKR